MATIIRESDIPSSCAGKPKYPWDEWFDGQARMLSRGEDFEAVPLTFRAQIVSAAHRKGRKVTIRLTGDVIYVQALD